MAEGGKPGPKALAGIVTVVDPPGMLTLCGGDVHGAGGENEVRSLLQLCNPAFDVYLGPISSQGFAVLGFGHGYGKPAGRTAMVFFHGDSQAVFQARALGGRLRFGLGFGLRLAGNCMPA